MSYRCAISGELLPAGQPAHRLVVAVRPVTYPSREKAIRRRVPGKSKRQLARDPGGRGSQIAREVLVSAEVAARYRNHTPDMLPERPFRRRRQEVIEHELYGGPGDSV